MSKLHSTQRRELGALGLAGSWFWDVKEGRGFPRPSFGLTNAMWLVVLPDHVAACCSACKSQMLFGDVLSEP